MELSKESTRKHFVGPVNAAALKVKEPEEGLLRLSLGRKVLVLPGGFAVLGALAILWYFGLLGEALSGIEKTAAIPIIGAIVMLVAVAVALRSRLMLEFSKGKGTFAVAGGFLFGPKAGGAANEVPLASIAGVQLLFARPAASCACGCTGGTYEVNLVLKDPENERVGLVKEHLKAPAQELAGKIAQFVGVPLIEHCDESCSL
jgi:hypothetical protein